MNTADSYYLINNAASSFLIDDILVISALSSDLKSISSDVFYIDYAETSDADDEFYKNFSTAISPITALFRTTSFIFTATLNRIAISSTINSLTACFLEISFYFYAFLFAQMILVVIWDNYDYILIMFVHKVMYIAYISVIKLFNCELWM